MRICDAKNARAVMGWKQNTNMQEIDDVEYARTGQWDCPIEAALKMNIA